MTQPRTTTPEPGLTRTRGGAGKSRTPTSGAKDASQAKTNPGPLRMYPLDPQQRDAASDVLGPILIIGGPGVGKTHTLIGRINRLLESRAKPNTITYVTFGARNADETRQTLEELIEGPQPFVGTLHQYASYFLRNAGASVLGISPYYSIWDHQQATECLQELARQNPEELRFTNDELERFLHWKGFNQARDNTGSPTPPPEGYWHTMLDLYTQEKYRQQTLDLDDIIPAALEAMETNPQLSELWSGIRTKHLLVDEFQDITRGQYRLLKKMVGPEQSIAVATDPNQSIYTWRGADPNLLNRFLLDFPQTKQHLLTSNHRATQTLTETARGLAGHADVHGLYDAGLQSLRLEGPSPEVYFFEGPTQQMDTEVIKHAERLHDEEGIPWEDMAFIYRRHSTSARLQGRLFQAGRHYTVLSEVLRAGEDDAAHIMSLLTILVNPMDVQAFALAAGVDNRRQKRRLSETVCGHLRRIAEEQEIDLVEAAELYRHTLKASDAVAQSLRYAVAAWRTLREACSADPEPTIGQLCRLTYERMHQERRQGHIPPPPPPEVTRLFIMADTTARLPGESAPKHLSRFLELARTSIYPDHRSVENADMLEHERGITLSTIHAAKGLQWPVVWLIDAADHIIPGPIREDSPQAKTKLEEEQRIFYVAATRATDRLHFCYAETTMQGKPAVASRYLEPLEEMLEFHHVKYTPPESEQAG